MQEWQFWCKRLLLLLLLLLLLQIYPHPPLARIGRHRIRKTIDRPYPDLPHGAAEIAVAVTSVGATVIIDKDSLALPRGSIKQQTLSPCHVVPCRTVPYHATRCRVITHESLAQIQQQQQ